MKDRLSSASEAVRSFFCTVKDIFNKKRDGYVDITGLISPEDNRAAAAALLKELGKTVKVLFPKKSGRIRFAAGDPYTEGKILEALAFLYPVYADRLEIVPDFESEEPDAAIRLKGRFCVISLLLIAARVYFNKKIRHLYKQLKELTGNGGRNG